MAIIITVAVILFLLITWAMSTQRQLVVMEENVDHAISQIGVHISSWFDTLDCLLDLLGEYAELDANTLMNTVKARRIIITAKSTPADILKQQEMLVEAFRQISILAERYPKLKANENYVKYVAAAEHFQKMARTARLIYNDSVTKLNRSVRMFPTNLMAGILGFHQRGYLEAIEG